MSSHIFTDKSLTLEAAASGWALAARRAFAEPGTTPQYPRDRDYTILHADVTVWIDPDARTFSSRTALRLAPRGANARGERARYHLDLESLTVASVTDADGSPLPFRHRDNVLQVDAPHAGEITLVVSASGTPERGLYFVGPDAAYPDRTPEAWTQCQDENARCLFPCFDHPSVKHPFTIHVHAPEGYTVLSNGRQVNEITWEQAEPMPAYLFTVVVARLDVYTESWDGIPVRYAVPAGTPADVVPRSFARTPAMVGFLSGLFGRYAWPRYDQVVVRDFIFGGMENTACTTLLDMVLLPASVEGEYDMDDLVVHELGHQWFGDLVTCESWAQAWLNEGWATYIQYLWDAHHKGQDEADYALFDTLELYLGEDGGRYRRPIISNTYRSPIDLFDRHLYEKGGLVLHTLRAIVGDDLFFSSTRRYLTAQRYGTAHTLDFQRAFEQETGLSLERFFTEWVSGAGHPELEVSLSHSGAGATGQLQVTVKQGQSGEGVANVFHLPLTLSFNGQSVTLSLDARERTYVLPCPEAPAWVGVDSAFSVLSALTLKGPRSLLEGALTSDPRVIGRIRAARALAAEASPAATRALIAALSADAFWGVRAQIASLLADLGSELAVNALIAAAKAEAHPKVRAALATALGRCKRPDDDTRVGDALVPLTSDASLFVRAEAILALGKLRDARTRALAEALVGVPTWANWVPARAVQALGQLRDASVLPALLEASGPTRDVRIRAAAASALARLGDEVEATRTTAVERLIALAKDAPFRVRLAAISGLGTLKDPRGLAVLDALHTHAPDGRIQRMSYEAATTIREGRTSEAGLAGLRKELEGLKADSRKLQDQIWRMESPRS